MKFRFLFIFLFAAICSAQSGQISGISLQNISGYAKVQPATSVYLCTYNSGLICTTPSGETGMYSDVALTQLITQPLLSDSNGHYNYFVNTGIEYLEKDCFTAFVCQTYPVFVTASSGGATGLTEFSSGNLSPLFTTNVLNNTTTPAQSFTLDTAANTTFFGNFSGSTGNPSYYSLLAGTNVSITPSGNTVTISAGPALQTNSVNNSSQSLLNLVAGNNVTLDNVSGGEVLISSSTGVAPFIALPSTAQHVILFPTTSSSTGAGTCAGGTVFGASAADGTNGSASVGASNCGSSGRSSSGTVNGFILPTYINPSDVSQVYVGAISNWVQTGLIMSVDMGCSNITPYYSTGFTIVGNPVSMGNVSSAGPYTTQQTTTLTTYTGTDIPNIGCEVFQAGSASGSGFFATANASSIFLIVYGTWTAPTASPATLVNIPLTLSLDGNGNQDLGIDTTFPFPGKYLIPSVFANLPNASSVFSPGAVYFVPDGASSSCAAGGGSTPCLLYTNGATYTGISLGGGSCTNCLATLNPGSNAAGTLQAAITAAVAGSTIILPASYTETPTSGITIAKALTLECQPGAAITRGANGNLVTITSSNVAIKGCTFNGGGFTGDTILATSVSGIQILGNTILNGNGVGIFFSGVTNSRVQNNSVQSNNADDIVVFDASNNDVISNNIIDNSQDLVFSKGVSIHSNSVPSVISNITVANNTFKNRFGFVIEVGPFNGYMPTSINISGNVAIQLSSTHAGSGTSGNFGGYSIFADTSTTNGNTYTNESGQMAGLPGLEIFGQTHNASNNTITGAVATVYTTSSSFSNNNIMQGNLVLTNGNNTGNPVIQQINVTGNVVNTSGVIPGNAWNANTALEQNYIIKDTNGCLEKSVFRLSVSSNLTGSTQPTWPACTQSAAGTFTADNNITWMNLGPPMLPQLAAGTAYPGIELLCNTSGLTCGQYLVQGNTIIDNLVSTDQGFQDFAISGTTQKSTVFEGNQFIGWTTCYSVGTGLSPVLWMNDETGCGATGGIASAAHASLATAVAGGGGSGTTIDINGSSVASTLNLNSTTPAVDAGFTAATLKYTSGNAIIEFPTSFPTMNDVVFGDSIQIVSLNSCLISTTTSVAPSSAWSITSNVVTFTAPNGYQTGNVVVPQSPTFPGNGQLLTVSATGLSGTQWEAPYTHANASATEVGTTDCAYNYSGQLRTLPYFKGHGTVYNVAIGGSTTASQLASYTSVVHPLSPVVTGIPAIFDLETGTNDFLTGVSAATTEANLQTLWANAHADGFIVLEKTIPPLYTWVVSGSLASWQAVNDFIRGNGPNSIGVPTGQYWDRLADIEAVTSNSNDAFGRVSGNPHFTDAYNALNANQANQAMSAQGTALTEVYTCTFYNNCITTSPGASNQTITVTGGPGGLSLVTAASFSGQGFTVTGQSPIVQLTDNSGANSSTTLMELNASGAFGLTKVFNVQSNLDSSFPSNMFQLYASSSTHADFNLNSQMCYAWSSGSISGAVMSPADTELCRSAAGVVAVNGVALAPQLSGVSGSIGGSPLTAGNCASGTVTVTGAVVGHTVGVSASDGTLPNALATLSASVTATNTVSVQVCAIAAVTPTSKTYNVTTY